MADLPEAVRLANEAAEAAGDAYDAEANGDKDSSSSLDELVPDADDQTDTDDVSAQSDEDGSTDDSTDEGTAVDDTDATEVNAEAEAWKQKYNTLSGKYNAEIPRLMNQVSFLTGKLDGQPDTPATDTDAAPAKADGYKKYLKDTELEDYDADILNFQSRVAKGEAEAVVGPEVQKLRARIEQLESSASSTEDTSMWDAIEKHYPGAQAVNVDPLFSGYLDELDPVSGQPRRVLGEAAFASGDIGRIVSLFEGYASSTGGDVSASPDKITPKKVKPPVKPSAAKGSTVRTDPKVKPVIKESEMAMFYADVARGKYRGREKVMKARDAIIESAVIEGRVVAG